MTPIVNGLEAEYGERVEFKLLNVGLDDGKRFFEFYGLRGHPSYVLLGADGEVLWRGFGPMSAESLTSEIEKIIRPSTDPG